MRIILVIANPRQRMFAREQGQRVKKPRIAIIGDTEFQAGKWTDAVAIAIETAIGWDAEVGLRTVAADIGSARLLRRRLQPAGVTSWLTVRNGPDDPGRSAMHADVRMGDPLRIPELFDHDVIVLASRDSRLRRFLADLPVHTRPDVRIIACLHFERGPILGERLEDLLRFDTLVASEDDFHRLNRSVSNEPPLHVLSAVQQRMVGSNLRAAIAWNERGSFSLAEPLRSILSVASAATSPAPDLASWPAFVGAVAVGVARRDSWADIGRSATQAYARHSYT